MSDQHTTIFYDIKNLHALTHHTKPDGSPYPVHECPIYMACTDGTVHQGSDEFFYRKNGSAIPISYSSRPILDMGRIIGAVICFKDISERKLAEERLRDSEERLRILFNGINDAVFVHEGQENGIPGRFIEVNDSACERLGYSRNELLIMRPIDIDAPEMLPNIHSSDETPLRNWLCPLGQFSASMMIPPWVDPGAGIPTKAILQKKQI